MFPPAAFRSKYKKKEADLFAAAALPPPHIPLPLQRGAPAAQTAAAAAATTAAAEAETAAEAVEGAGAAAAAAAAANATAATAAAAEGGSTSVLKTIKTHLAAQRVMHHKMWGALTKREWPLFSQLLSNYWYTPNPKP